jgi:hypothetical protein
MFGEQGKEAIDTISMDRDFLISSPRDIWKMYNEYLARTANRMGIDVAQVIRFESLKEMESMLCTKCPLYQKIPR